MKIQEALVLRKQILLFAIEKAGGINKALRLIQEMYPELEIAIRASEAYRGGANAEYKKV